MSSMTRLTRAFRSPARQSDRRNAARKLKLEWLEDRTVPALLLDSAFAIGGSAVQGDAATAVAVDTAGNTYVYGYFAGTMDADPEPGEWLLTSAGQNDLYVAKYDALGALQWAARMGGPEHDTFFGGGIAVDGTGNVCVTGTLRGTADFGPFALTSQGRSDIFVAKLDAGGAFQWVTRMGESSDTLDFPQEGGFAVAVDGQGNVYTTGRMYPTTSLAMETNGSIFVAKHDASGNLLWLGKMGELTVGGGEGHALALDASGNVFVTGQFVGQIDFNPGPGTYTLSSTAVKGLRDNWDACVVSLDTGGSFRWAFNISGNKHDYGNAIAVDGAGNIYLAGDFASTANDFDPGKAKAPLVFAGGYSDIFVAKYTSSRKLVWSRGLGGTDEDHVSSMALGGSGIVHLAGHFWGTADFDPGAGSFTLTNTGSRDAFVAQLDSAGNFAWAGQMGGDVYQAGGNDLAVDSNGTVYAAGYFRGTADMDPSPGQTLLTSSPDANGNPTLDGFLVRLSTAPALTAVKVPLTSKKVGLSLDANQLQPILDEALSRWQAAGKETSFHGAIDIRISDLGGATLGLASGNTIWLDTNAAGWGWFIDPTPWDESEFRRPGNQGEQNRMDLLTVLAHELGHLLGFDHGEPGTSPTGDVMQETLSPGERLVPHAADLDAFWVLAGLPQLTKKREPLAWWL